MRVFGQDSDVYFGDVNRPFPKWRKVTTPAGEDDPDDEQLNSTPPDIIAMLGFDPLEAADD